jgi:hypothetical protein
MARLKSKSLLPMWRWHGVTGSWYQLIPLVVNRDRSSVAAKRSTDRNRTCSRRWGFADPNGSGECETACPSILLDQRRHPLQGTFFAQLADLLLERIYHRHAEQLLAVVEVLGV